MAFRLESTIQRILYIVRHPHSKKIGAAGVLAVMLGTLVIPTIVNMGHANALSNFVQNDWSGGVGTDIDAHQYGDATNVNPTNNSVSIGTDGYTDWCSTANCNSDWLVRKPIFIVNDNGPQTDMQVVVTIDKEAEMKSNFDDLRFVNQAGDQEISYFAKKINENTNAEIVLKFPALDSGRTFLYVYYGNGAANSISNASETMTFSDRFTELEGTTGGNQYWGGCPQVAYTNGEANLPRSCNIGMNQPYNRIDNSTDVIGEYDFKLDLTGASNCDSYQNANYEKFNETQEPGVEPFFIDQAVVPGTNCSKWYIHGIGITGRYNDPQFAQYRQPNEGYQFNSNQYYRFRFVNRASGGVLLYFSTNNGDSYTEVPNVPNNSLQQKTGLLFTSDQFPVSVKNLYIYKSLTGIYDKQSAPQYYGGRSGVLTSATIDMGQDAYFGKVNMDIQGGGLITVRLQSSNDADQGDSGTMDWCTPIKNTYEISDSNCVTPGDRYIRYQVLLSDNGDHDLQLNSITLEHDNDSVAPSDPGNITIKSSNNGSVIAADSWMNVGTPYFEWGASNDNDNGSGVLAYCLYLGTDANADTTTSGIITGAENKKNTGSKCQQGTGNTYFNTSNYAGGLSSNQTYYFKVRALDKTGNLSSVVTTTFKFDSQLPQAQTLFTYPSAVNSTVVKVSWIGGLGSPPFTDNESGVAGLKYCVTSVIAGLSGCAPTDNNWYGPNHGSGSINDISDVFPTSANQLTTSPLDAARLDDAILGYNSIMIAVVDNAGNANGDFGTPHIFQITYTASDAPANLQVTPTSSNANNFAFTWSRPVTLYGDRTEAEYCWSVNEPIAADGSNCNWTGKNVYALSAGAYATQQGTNTMYIATKDVTGNFDGTKFASIDFSTNTVAPGLPQDLDISDVSIRATSSWKLALSWTAPTQSGAGVARYKVLRSTDDVSYAEVGSTTSQNTSFIDAGLNAVLYYYKIQACDNANSCGIPSASANKKPTGRFTEPAKLTADTDQPKLRDITTRKATILWYTDRESDSRIALGTKSGQYFSEEIGNSTQTSNHVINLTNLEPGTTYYYVAKWTDGDGNTGQSIEHTLTTLPAPAISDVVVSQLSISSALVSFKTKEAAKISLYYGKSEAFGDVVTIDTSSEESTYSVQLTGLGDGTKYFFKLNGYDVDGNEYQGNIYSLTTPARPVISNLSIDTVEGEPSSTKKISWNTNVPTTSVVTYTPKDGKDISAIDSSLTVTHQVIIKQLLDDTDYSLVARSADIAGNVAISETRLFHTALDTRPPKVTDISIETTIRGNGTDARGQIVVTWRTDEPATSQLAYGQGESGDFTSRTPVDDRLTTEHTMIISNLSTASIYRVEVISADKAGNSVVSQPETAIIGRPSDNVFSIILTALQKVFGVNN